MEGNYFWLHSSKYIICCFLLVTEEIYKFGISNSVREKLLDHISWKGDEIVLDVGCGNGILLMGAAKRLTTGKAIGIDTWIEFAGDSRSEIFLNNAEIEGVTKKISLENEDVHNLSYKSETFDVIITGLTMHHLFHNGDAKKAVREMSRVLKPGGMIAVYDVPIAVYSSTKLMKECGLNIETKYSNMVFGVKPI